MTYRNLFGAVFGASFLVSATSAVAADLAAGEKVFRKCKVCHTLEEGGKKKIGPNLFGIIGRTSGTAEGFKYSKAMKNSDIVWNDCSLDSFLKKPRKYIKGTKMRFSGLKNKSHREALIKYLKENQIK